MVIGITGTDGAGKGAVVRYLVEQKGFTHYSSRALITAEIEAQGLPINRENMRLVANQMRKEYGLGVIVTTALKNMQSQGVKLAVIESIRALAEADELDKVGGKLLAVDADQALRYERITGRRSESDTVTFEEFAAQEAIEMNDPDPNGMQKAAVMKRADYTIENSGSLANMHRQINDFLKTIND